MDYDKALGNLDRYLEAEWELYDKVAILQDSRLSLLDILLSNTMNARLDTGDKIKSIWNGKAAIEEALSQIPPTLSLDDENIPWDTLVKLLDAACATKFVGPAVSTKILHKKRPALIPIIDRVSSKYLATRRTTPLPMGLSEAEHIVADIKAFREKLLAEHQTIIKLCEACTLKGFPITPVRTLDILIWVENEPRATYRRKSGN